MSDTTFTETPLSSSTFSLDAVLAPLDSIVVGDRMRVDYGDLDSLCASLTSLGQLQPIVVTRNEHGLLLVAGGRRYAAAKKLKWKVIQIVERENIDETTYRAMELAENMDRKQMTWQEGVKTFKAAFAHQQQRDHTFDLTLAGRFFNKSTASVSMLLTIADYLHEPTVVNAEHPTAAYRAVLALKRKEAEDLQAQRQKARALVVERRLSTTLPTKSASTTDEDEEEDDEDLELENEPDDDIAIDPVELALIEPRNTAARRIFTGDCCEVMQSMPAREFHAIITDLPYAIDMDNLTNDQLELTRSEHDVDENLSLYERLFAPMYRVLKENSFAICFIDLQHFSLLTKLATEAGFSVCNWPITWVKTTPCSNQAPFDNFTKTVENAIVLKKGKPKLCEVATRSDFSDGLTRKELERFVHPFSKPRRLTQWLAKKILSPGSLVLDPFCGQGSMLCALAEAGHTVFGIELIEDHASWAREQLARSIFNPKQFDDATISL